MSRADAPPTIADSLTMPSPLPPCPQCGYDLTGTVKCGGDRCPECGWEFSPQDLVLLGPSNPKGEPRSLKPSESRMRGP